MKKFLNIMIIAIVFVLILFANISFAVSDEDVAFVLEELKYFEAGSELTTNSLNKERLSFVVDNDIISKLAEKNIYFVLMKDPIYSETIIGIQNGTERTTDVEPIYADGGADEFGDNKLGFKSVARLENHAQSAIGHYVYIDNEGLVLLPDENANYAFTTIDSTSSEEYKLTIKNMTRDEVSNFEPSDKATNLDEVKDQINGAEITEEELEDLRTKSPFEQVITEFFLSVGDYAQDYLSQTFREEITIDRIVFNRTVMLNANFFDKSANPSTSITTKVVKKVINEWYSFLKKLTLVIIMIFILVAGIKIILGTPNGKAKAKDIFMKIVMGAVLIYFFPYVMRYAFDINEEIVSQIYEESYGVETVLGSKISQVSDFTVDDLEFRSPQYVSAGNDTIAPGSKEATEMYLSKVEDYKASADLMRIMRAFAGVTLRFMYVIIWYILLVQTYIMVIIYIKRYIILAFLVAVYPLVVIGYLSGNMFGKGHTALNQWCSKFFTNVFLQTIHAIIFGVITSVLVQQIRDTIIISSSGEGLPEAKSMNWILMVVATSFLFSAEKIIGKLWSAAIDTSERSGMGKFLKMPGNLWKKMKG